MTRVATIDIGTNTVLLLVAERRPDGSLVAVEEHATITRLGEGVDRTRVLLPAAIARTTECLTRYAGVLRALGAEKVAVVGTSAMRDAHGGEEVREHVLREMAVEARVISGDEEARLTFAGAVSGLSLEGTRKITVFDIGGGSTEVVHGTLDERGRVAEIEFAHSFDVGSVRLTERAVRGDPPNNAEMAALRTIAGEAFSSVPGLDDQPERREVVGIAGTMTTLAAVSLSMTPYDGARLHGHMMLRREMDQTVRDLAAMPLNERRQVLGLEPKRADVIVAGGVIALALLERLRVNRVRISDRGVRWGLAEQLA